MFYFNQCQSLNVINKKFKKKFKFGKFSRLFFVIRLCLGKNIKKSLPLRFKF